MATDQVPAADAASLPETKVSPTRAGESGFSRHKRLLGSALTAKREDRQFDEIRMRVLTHNLMLIAAAA